MWFGYIKRFTLVDDTSLIWRVICIPANKTEIYGAEIIIRKCFESKEYPITVKVILGDKGFCSKKLQKLIYTLFYIYLITPLKKHNSKLWTKEDEERYQEQKQIISNIMYMRRYKVEQVFAQLNQFRLLTRNYTRNIRNHETDVKIANIVKCLKRLG